MKDIKPVGNSKGVAVISEKIHLFFQTVSFIAPMSHLILRLTSINHYDVVILDLLQRSGTNKQMICFNAFGPFSVKQT